jgi:hypothetical protein
MSGGGYVMRDLSVYYCSQCGFYAYYQLPKNAICHRCDIAMTLIEMRYQDFMNLDYELITAPLAHPPAPFPPTVPPAISITMPRASVLLAG